MKIGIVIMSTNKEPSLRNMQAMKDTFVTWTKNLKDEKKLKHSYEFVIYYGTDEPSSDKDVILTTEDTDLCIKEYEINEVESVYKTYEKTYKIFKEIADRYDFIVRINISAFVNISLLDAIIEKLDRDVVYCNAINTIINPECEYANSLYPRGDFYIISNKTLHGIIDNGLELLNCDSRLKNRIEVPHVDDVLTGIALIKYFGKTYYEHLTMIYYNFCPDENISISNLNKYSVASRVKTVPPTASNSGYSWDDNEYRKKDCSKMKELVDYYSNIKYSDITKNMFIVPKEYTRQTLFVQTTPLNIYSVFRF